MSFHPYLNFDGTCREAFTRYHEIFGGDLTILGSEVMPADEDAPDFGDRVIHAALVTADGGLLMASDTQPGVAVSPQGTYVNYATGTVEDAARVWKELSAGGTVEMDLGPTFFSPAYGICADRFGTLWMVSAASPDQQG